MMKDALSADGAAILELFNLQDTDVDRVDLHSADGQLTADIELADLKPPCKHCGMSRTRIKEKTVKLIKHGAIAGRPCIINYHARRYKCLCCGRTFYEDNPFVFKAQKISALAVTGILEDLKNPAETFSNAARRYNVSPTTVASIFDEHVDMPRLALPRYMCIDENYCFRSDKSKYACVLVDFETGEPVDILPSRHMDDLLAYFRNIPLEERRNVKVVGIDMWKTYRSVVKYVLPNAVCAADHYHVKAEMHKKIDRIRIRVMKKFKSDTDEYYLCKKFHWLLSKHSDEKDKDGSLLLDPEKPGRFNKKFGREMNYHEILELIKCIDGELAEAIELKDRCNAFYADSTYDTAEKNLKHLIREFRNAQSAEMREFGDTLAEWKNEVINSFIIVDNEYSVSPGDGHVVSRKIRINSSIIERVNGTIKLLKKATMSMGNWERFRNRVLYSLRKNAAYRLNPIDTPRARKNYKFKDSRNHR